jgi:Carboxypeptidase regulatory-like domain
MRIPRRILIVLALVVTPALLAAGGENKPSGQASSIKFVVLKDDNNKPVRNAAVILHPVGKSGKQSKGGFELKTDAEGRTQADGVPYGLLRVQVIAPGFQTFGDDYTINQTEQVVTVRLKRPSDQYTIYDKPGSGPPKDQQ